MSNLANDPEGSIPVESAAEMTSNWRQYLSTSGQAFVTTAFLIPIASFTNILLFNPTAEGVRAYISLEDPLDPTTAKLILVPVVEGQDVPFVETPLEGGLGGEHQSNVYDLTTACPPTCSVGSVLNS
jgi:hypothetical protein